MENLKSVLEVLMYTMITTFGAVAIAKLSAFINKKIDNIQKNTKLANYELLNKMIDKAQDTIDTAVAMVSQTYVDSLKDSGAFTNEAQKIAKDKAITTAKNLINDEGVLAINEIYGDVDEYISAYIEAKIKTDK